MSVHESQNQELLPSEFEITAYRPYVAQLREMAETNRSLIFDYHDPEQNKAARSHIYQLRKTRAAVDKARKAEKEESLRYGKLVDSEAKRIIGEIEAMINVHQKPIDEIDARERARVDAIQKRISVIANLANGSTVGTEESVATLKLMLADVEQFEVDETFGEFAAEAIGTRKRAIDYLTDRIEQRAKYEAEQEELARLRAQQAAQEQKARDEKIARESEERARAEAAAKQEQERAAAEQRERQLIAEKQKAEQEAHDAEQRALRAAKETEERIKREADEKAKSEAAEAKRRENDRRIADRVNNAAAQDLMNATNIDEKTAKEIVLTIAAGKVAHIRITY